MAAVGWERKDQIRHFHTQDRQSSPGRGGASSGVECGVGSFGLDSIQDWTQHSSRGISGVRSLWGVTLK